MSSLVRALAGVVFACAISLAAPPGSAIAQQSYAQRQQQQRRLAAERALAGHRSEAARAHAAHCADVGEAVCAEETRRAQGEFGRLFVLPALRWIVLGSLAIGAFSWWTTRHRKRRLMRSLHPAVSRAGTAMSLDVIAIDIALEPAAADTVRAAVESALAHRHTLDGALADAARAILLARPAWTHTAVRSWPLAEASIAEERYATLVREAQARATLEGRHDAGPGYRGEPAAASAYEPVVMVSLTVLSSDELPEQGAPLDAASRALTALASLSAERIQRVDLTWLPGAPSDALSAAELLARQPRLMPIAR